jgi:hypothetical protein
LTFAALLGFVFGSKDDGRLTGAGQLKVYLVDTRASYGSLVLVVREVSVCSESQGWVVVNNTTRTFNLPQLTNGVRSVLGETTLEAGGYTQIRLLLDTDSYVAVRGKRHPLTMRSEFEKGIKCTHLFQIEARFLNELYLDFDPNGNACICACCKQFNSDLHASTSLEALGNNAQRRLRASKGSERCRCSDRWDHRQQNAQHCRHCASINKGVGAMG